MRCDGHAACGLLRLPGGTLRRACFADDLGNRAFETGAADRSAEPNDIRIIAAGSQGYGLRDHRQRYDKEEIRGGGELHAFPAGRRHRN